MLLAGDFGELRRAADFLPGSIEIERGGVGDYGELAHLHYAAGRPATVAGVWRAVYCDFGLTSTSSVESRILDFGFESGEQRAAADSEFEFNPKSKIPNPKSSRVIGVAVLSWPVPRSLAREAALGLGAGRDVAKLRWLNANLRTISRVIVHPQFRSLGIASALVRRVLLDCPVRYVEAFAVMGKILPFFEKAGMNVGGEGGDYFWMDRGEKC